MNTPTYTQEKNTTFLTLTPRGDSVARILITAHMPLLPKTPYGSFAFFADMLTRGSRRFTKLSYTEKLESLGAQVSFSSQGPYIHLAVTAREETLSQVLQILEDTLMHPLFLKTEITHLQKEYLQEIHEEQDNARGLAYALFTQTLYVPESPFYIPPLREQAQGIRHIQTALLRRIHTIFVSTQWTVSVAASNDALARVRSFLQKVHSETTTSSFSHATFSKPTSRTIYQFVPEKQNVELFIGNALPLTLRDPDFLPFSVAIDILGKKGGFSGRLMSTVREKEGLTYSIYAWIRNATTTTPGIWHVWTFFTEKDTPRGIASTMREITTLATEGVTEKELRTFKELLSNQFKLAHASMQSTLSLYHTEAVIGRAPEEVQSFPKRLQALTRTQIQTVLKKYLVPSTLIRTGAGPTQTLFKEK